MGYKTKHLETLLTITSLSVPSVSKVTHAHKRVSI